MIFITFFIAIFFTSIRIVRRRPHHPRESWSMVKSTWMSTKYVRWRYHSTWGPACPWWTTHVKRRPRTERRAWWSWASKKWRRHRRSKASSSKEMRRRRSVASHSWRWCTRHRKTPASICSPWKYAGTSSSTKVACVKMKSTSYSYSLCDQSKP